MSVDDNVFNLIPVGLLLDELKIKHDDFSDPKKALRAYKKSLSKRCCNKGYRLVITDIQMPSLDGNRLSEEILKELKEKK